MRQQYACKYTLNCTEDLQYALRSAMKLRGINQKQLAALCNVSQQSISAILRRGMVPSVALLHRMAIGLDAEFKIGGSFDATQSSRWESSRRVSELRDASHAYE